jgi:hypothetical protein
MREGLRLYQRQKQADVLKNKLEERLLFSGRCGFRNEPVNSDNLNQNVIKRSVDIVHFSSVNTLGLSVTVNSGIVIRPFLSARTTPELEPNCHLISSFG